MNTSEMAGWLGEKDPEKLTELFRKARACAVEHVGPKIYFRGLIELSNLCAKNCYYCGIRRDDRGLERFSMTEVEILGAARAAEEMGYGSIVLQSGERQDAAYALFIEKIIQKIKEESRGRLGITLSLGEQTPDIYERWFRAGAHRYLLRIETSDPALYEKLHPADHSFEARLDCLRALRRTGYQVGTGVMIGLPFQTHEDLIRDILFFREEDIDMIGMGPYIPHAGTPLEWPGDAYDSAEHFRLGLVMIALTRLALRDVNIAAATALQALDSEGREKGVLAGANVIMPNITPARYRRFYQLYEGKPCLDEDAVRCGGCLEARFRKFDFEIGCGEWGDSPHFKFRNGTAKPQGSLHAGL